ncbi:MAG: hypothetical protein DRI73_08035 [Bacteroidetes bacterium]|nr:MAG: hypothetical protein DRI73_08035 [Bacteroidota bacterium]
MNNPDEDTAAEQFGMGDKYFGICTMLSTMPGLPMFGHGQIEGFKEKYGMEYRKAYYDEIPNIDFIERHNREIFPLIKKRYLFSESENFQLYDLFNQEGNINENVFVWSNSTRDEHAIVFFNNSYNSAAGWINTAASKLNQPETSIGSSLRLQNSSRHYCIFKEQRSGLTFIRNSQNISEAGLYLHLNGYECQVFMDFKEVYDETGQWKQLEANLNGKGTIDIYRDLRQITLKEASGKLFDIFQKEMTEGLKDFILKKGNLSSVFLDHLQKKYSIFLNELKTSAYIDKQLLEEVGILFNETLKTIELLGSMNIEKNTKSSLWMKYIFRGFEIMPEVWTLLLVWITLFPLSKLISENKGLLLNIELLELIEDLNINYAIESSLAAEGIDNSHFHEIVKLALIIPAHKKWSTNEITKKSGHLPMLEKYLDFPIISDFIGRNYHQDIEWFKRENFQLFTWWIFILNTLKLIDSNRNSKSINDIFNAITQWLEGEENSDCQIDLLFESIRKL